MKKGFTLIELMVVSAVIGILAAISLPRFTDATASAKVAQVQGNLANLRTAIGMFHAKNDRYPSYEVSANFYKNSKETDISPEGELSLEFTDFYSRSEMPSTPAGAVRAEGANGEILGENHKVVPERTNEGGWLYIEEEGSIYANLLNGSYTGDPEKELWQEDVNDDNEGDGSPGDGDKPNVPSGPEDWGDFIDQDNTKLEELSQIRFDTEWIGDGHSLITPKDGWSDKWDKFYVYDETGNIIPNPESKDGSYEYGKGVAVPSNEKYVIVLEDSDSGDYLYTYIRKVNSWNDGNPEDSWK